MKYLKLFERFKLKLFHETDVANLESINKDGYLKVIDGERGKTDPLVPYGVFLKDTSENIFPNSTQIPIEFSFNKPMYFMDRYNIKDKMKYLSPEFRQNIERYDNIDLEYNSRSKQIIDDIINKKEDIAVLKKKHDEMISKWRSKQNQIALECKKYLTSYLKNNGYDVMVIEKDEGSWGRVVKTYISLYPIKIGN